jgi:hypothetical protein
MDVPDALLRILAPLARSQVSLPAISSLRTGKTVAIRIEAESISDARAETIRLQIAALPAVISAAIEPRPGPVAP